MRKLLFALMFFLAGTYARAQGTLYQLSPPAPNARVLVCPSPDNGYPCPVTANIFSDAALTQAIAQPVSLGSSGFFSFYISSGTYTIQLMGPGYNSGNRQVVTIGAGGGISSVFSLPALPCTNGQTVSVTSGGGVFSCINGVWVRLDSGTPPVTSGLVAQYAMTEGSGTTLTDSSGNGNSGTLASGQNTPLWLGGAQNPLFMDNFVQSGSGLNTNWTTIDGTFTVAANAVGASALGTLAGARITSIPWNIPSTNKFLANSSPTMDQYACTTAVVVPTGAVGIGPMVRMDNTAQPNNSYYALEFQGPGTNSFRLYKRVANSFTALSTTAGTYTVGDVMCLSAVGNTLTFTKNGVNIAAPITDTSIQLGFPGIAASGTTATSGTVGKVQAGNLIPSTSGGLLFGGGQFVTMPSSLNSAQTLQTFSCYQKSQNPNATNALIQGNGNGANSNANGIHLATDGAADQSNVAQTLPHVELLGGSSYLTAQQGVLNGCGVVTVEFGTSGTSFDQVFINGVEALYNQNFMGASAGLQTVGAYQMGGAAAGSGFTTASFFTGQQYYWLFYNRKLNNSEVLQNVKFLTDTMAARGVNAFSGDVQAKGSCAVHGDSIMAGNGLNAGQTWTELTTLTIPANAEAWSNGGFCWNQGVTAAAQTELSRVHSINIDPLISLASTRNVMVISGCSNDLFYGLANIFNLGSASACMAQQAQEAKQARTAGWKVLVTTILSRSYNAVNCTAGDAQKDLINPLIRNNWSTYADGLVDLGETLTMGADTTCTGTSFRGDFIHPSIFAVNTLAPLFQHAIDKLFGAQDFSQATTYGSAAPAAVATTAGTSSGQIATLTFGAVPCASGQTITVAGVTPAGYNGTFFILPGSTATTLTYTTSGSNIGPITVQGTGVCPQQRSQDKYMVINFGAGNFTIDSCAGYTGQNIYIRNINAGASTLVPLGSETITGGGAAPTTLAAASTAILQSQLVSNTAGGCNWVRLQ